jgi:UDP-N-acetylglucosamine--N-acetylmuramyl-(pentapeptide) pyrophosphoryl-undecaprenol N-acetylglucosamine transferase
MSNVNIVLVGGGTGGHFYPLIAIGEALRSQIPNLRLYYAGTEKFDPEALTSIQAQYVYIPSGKYRRYHSLLNYFDSVKILFGVVFAQVNL